MVTDSEEYYPYESYKDMEWEEHCDGDEFCQHCLADDYPEHNKYRQYRGTGEGGNRVRK